MYEIHFNKKFKTAYKKVLRSGKFKFEEFNNIIRLLEKGEKLPSKYWDHSLTGNLIHRRECHISGDMLLVYEIDHINMIVLLEDVGNHAQVFGS